MCNVLHASNSLKCYIKSPPLHFGKIPCKWKICHDFLIYFKKYCFCAQRPVNLFAVSGITFDFFWTPSGVDALACASKTVENSQENCKKAKMPQLYFLLNKKYSFSFIRGGGGAYYCKKNEFLLLAIETFVKFSPF